MADTNVKEAQLGKNKILMFRKYGDTKAAAKLALQTEHKWEYSRDADTTKTKDGAVVAIDSNRDNSTDEELYHFIIYLFYKFY